MYNFLMTMAELHSKFKDSQKEGRKDKHLYVSARLNMT